MLAFASSICPLLIPTNSIHCFPNNNCEYHKKPTTMLETAATKTAVRFIVASGIKYHPPSPSRSSRAVSQKMDLLEIGSWAKKKGIHLASTSDWTHPIWFRELSAQLKETQAGIYSVDGIDDVSFILSTEISSIYSQGGVTRRVHNLFFAPNLSSVEKFNKKT